MRLPIRVRLTAWYVALLAAIIAVLGTFVVLQFRADMEASIDRDLRRSIVEMAHDYAEDGVEDFADASSVVLPRGAVAQALDADGRVLASAGLDPGLGAIAPDAARDVQLGRSTVRSLAIGPARSRFRALAVPVERLGQRQVLVIAEPLRDIDASVRRVLMLMLLAVPAALTATALCGWWLARKALLPVDRMISKAEHIGIDRLHERIAVPPTADEVARLAVTLNAMLDRLEEGVAEKQRLVADASHELRTPLAVMRAELDVSLRGDELSAPERTVLESVREEVDHMSRTVGNLLILAQADEGRLELLTIRTSLGEAIEAAARPLARLAHAKDIRLEVEDDVTAQVQADPQRLHQALTNLIHNAIMFTPPGGDVRVTPWVRGDEVGVRVTDTGPGIAGEALPHVFDRFFRADRARRRAPGGSGLGLAICREIARAHGGRIWVESEFGHGSAFSLALPRDRSPVAAPVARVRRAG
ncbi:MAG: two-component system, OmpR family, heavy metal sensor histidine kinase CusS [bacterium]